MHAAPGPRSDLELAVEQAQAAVLDRTPLMPIVDEPLADAMGRVLAGDLEARLRLPQADMSVMDGWAIRSVDLAPPLSAFVSLRKAGESAAGHPLPIPIGPSEAARISTGAVLPPGADTVVAQEDVIDRGSYIQLDAKVAAALGAGNFVRKAGTDVELGERLLSCGTLLGPGDLALLAAAGHGLIPLHRPPRVAIVCTGDELVPVGGSPAPGQIVSTNGLMLSAMVQREGAVPELLPDVGDDLQGLRNSCRRGLSCDVLVTSGGISVGDHDHVYEVLSGLQCRFVFRKLRLRPGRPTAFGITDAGTLVFALPGNPASSFVTFELFVRPAVRKMMGRAPLPHRIRLPLATEARGAGNRAHYLRARIVQGRVHPLPRQSSGDLRSISRVDALAIVPEGIERLPAGSEIETIAIDAFHA